MNESLSNSYITVSDISAALVGYGFAKTYNLSKPEMQAVQSFAVSMIARLSALNILSSSMTKLDPNQKNQLVVAILSAIAAAYRSQPALKGALTGVSCDVLAESLLRLLKWHDDSIFNWSKPAGGG